MVSITSHFPCIVQPLPSGKVQLTIEIDAVHARAFLSMLESLGDFFRILNTKAKSAIAIAHSTSMQKSGSEQYDRFCSSVLQTFNKLQADTDLPSHRLISVVNYELKPLFPFTTYNTVKQVLQHSGALRKCGFYAKK